MQEFDGIPNINKQGIGQSIKKIRVALVKRLDGFRVNIDPPIMPRRGLAQHHRTTAQVRFNVGIMRRHFGNDFLINAAGRFASQIAHSLLTPKK